MGATAGDRRGLAVAVSRAARAWVGLLALVTAAVAQDPETIETRLSERLETAKERNDTAALLQLLAEAERLPVRTRHASGFIYGAIASEVAARCNGPDLPRRLRAAFDVDCHWAHDERLSEHARATASQHASWLATRLLEDMLRRGAPSREVFDFLESVPIWPGDYNGLWLVVARADCLSGIGRHDDAQRVLEDIELARFEGEHRSAAAVLVAACRADLDVTLGNHDEALRKLAPLRREGKLLATCAQLDSAALLRYRRAYIRYLMAAERFAEVADVVAEPLPTDAAPLPPAGTELLAMLGAVAALADSGAEDVDRERMRATLDRLGRSAQAEETRCWAFVLAARDALRTGDPDAARTALEEAKRLQIAQSGALRQTIETAELDLLLQRRNGPDAATDTDLRAASERIERVWISLQAEVSRLPSRPGGVGFLHYAFRRDVLAQRIALRLALDPSPLGLETAFDLVLDADAALKGTAVARGPRPDLKALRQVLVGKDHGVLVYVLGGASSHVFAVDGDSILHATLAGTYELHAQMRDLAKEITGALVDFDGAADQPGLDPRRRQALRRIEQCAGAAADAVLPAAIRAAMADWKRLSIVGSEMLPQLPFECLPFDGLLLGERFAVDHWPSIGFATRHGSAAPRRGMPRLALFGRIRRDGEDVGLSPDFVAPWLQDYEDPEVRLEERCTLEQLTRLGATDVLVVMGHGERRRDLVRPLVLRLEDGLLTCDDLARIAPPTFAILAACNAAVGPNRFGAPLRADLAGAFLERGSRAVAASPFALRLEPTTRVLAAALPLLRAGVPPAEAMQRARRALWIDVDAGARSAQTALDRWTTAPLTLFGCGQLPLF